MNVLLSARTEALLAAFTAAIQSPLSAVCCINLDTTSSKEDVTLTFTKVFLSRSKNNLTSLWSQRTLAEGIELFLREKQIPDFVARFIAGVSIGEIDPSTVIAQPASPP